MGCPVPKIVAKGQGAALMAESAGRGRRLPHVARPSAAAHHQDPRGWDERTLNAVRSRSCRERGLEAITVHPRTRSQQFTGVRRGGDRAVVAAVRVPVVGNGDVRSVDDAHAMVAATGCAAVMIGRGALGTLDLPGAAVSRAERAAIIARHCALIDAHLPSASRWCSSKAPGRYSTAVPAPPRCAASVRRRDAGGGSRAFLERW